MPKELITGDCLMPEFVYYVCNEFGETMYEYYSQLDAMEMANRYDGYFVSRRAVVSDE